MNKNIHGIISNKSNRPDDYLYRISLKALIYDDRGRILVVKESGRKYWDLPGGGIDHGESIEDGLLRELREEVSFEGVIVSSRVISVDNPVFLSEHLLWQLRIVLVVETSQTYFSPGKDCSDIMFIEPHSLVDSTDEDKVPIVRYHSIAKTTL